MAVLFAEELAIVLEVSETCVKDVILAYEQNGIPCVNIGNSVGSSGPEAQVSKISQCSQLYEFITARQRSCGKVMFSVVSIRHSIHRGCPM